MNKYRIQQIKISINQDRENFTEIISKYLNVSEDKIKQFEIIKKSVDARKKNQICFVYTIDAELFEPINEKILNNNIIMLTKETEYTFPVNSVTKIQEKHRPVIIGSGPAGLFCALLLAENGYRPIVLERGKEVRERIEDVNIFFEKALLNPNSNIQFGEGGAGTFSDGKLNTQVKDSFSRKTKILKEFVDAGAPEEILYYNKPHIGTNYLVTVVENIRKKILSAGGEFYFSSQVTDLIIENNKLKGLVINQNRTIPVVTAALAIGHSARDTFNKLHEQKVSMEQKPFAVGVRIEHLQKTISENQYGQEFENNKLPVADYKLTYRTKKGRAVYTFCMCPGGYVVNSASEAEHIVCNGMSNFERNSKNANSAVLVNILTEDFPSKHVLAGVEFQRELEKKAFIAGGSNYNMPVQLFGDFSNNIKTTKLGNISPCLKGSYSYSNLRDCFPEYISEALIEGINNFERNLKGFASKDAILTGVETRSSSPVRILRNDSFESNIEGLFPCGEGAGYAGGIMSAAMDGIKVAEAIANKYQIVYNY